MNGAEAELRIESPGPSRVVNTRNAQIEFWLCRRGSIAILDPLRPELNWPLVRRPSIYGGDQPTGKVGYLLLDAVIGAALEDITTIMVVDSDDDSDEEGEDEDQALESDEDCLEADGDEVPALLRSSVDDAFWWR